MIQENENPNDEILENCDGVIENEHADEETVKNDELEKSTDGSDTIADKSEKIEDKSEKTSVEFKGNNDRNQYDFKPMQRVVRARLATLRENPKSGWQRLVTVTQWGGGKFKLDVRDWSSDMSRSTKGITFTRSEAEKLRNILSIIDLNIIDDYSQEETDRYMSNGERKILKAG